MSPKNEPAITEAEDLAEQPFDTADPEQVNAARKKSARLRREGLEFVKALMDTPQGRYWMYGILDFCHMYQTPFTPGDQHTTSFKLGEQNVGTRLLADVMAAAPDQYVVMVREGKAKR